MLSNRQRFINFFRTYPSDESFVPAVTSFIQFYGWKRILFITQDQGLFTAVSTNARAHILCHWKHLAFCMTISFLYFLYTCVCVCVCVCMCVCVCACVCVCMADLWKPFSGVDDEQYHCQKQDCTQLKTNVATRPGKSKLFCKCTTSPCITVQLALYTCHLLQSPDGEDIRVILINTYSDVARIVICEVGGYKRKYNYFIIILTVRTRLVLN